MCKPGDVIEVDKLEVQDGEKIQLNLLFDGQKAVNNKIIATVVQALCLGEKIRIYKTKRRKGYEKTIGFRAKLTKLLIGEA